MWEENGLEDINKLYNVRVLWFVEQFKQIQIRNAYFTHA